MGIIIPTEVVTIMRAKYQVFPTSTIFESKKAKINDNKRVTEKYIRPTRRGFFKNLEKLNFFLERQAVISDPSQKFSLEMQIEETQQQINEAKAKLGI